METVNHRIQKDGTHSPITALHIPQSMDYKVYMTVFKSIGWHSVYKCICMQISLSGLITTYSLLRFTSTPFKETLLTMDQIANRVKQYP